MPGIYKKSMIGISSLQAALIVKDSREETQMAVKNCSGQFSVDIHPINNLRDQVIDSDRFANFCIFICFSALF